MKQVELKRYLAIALALYFAIAASAYLMARKGIREAYDKCEREMRVTYEMRDNAEERARQYEAEYQAAVLEIAELKAENERPTEMLGDLVARELMSHAEYIPTTAIEASLQLLKPAYENAQTSEEPEFDYDFDYVVRVVGAECRGEPFEGILAVCQCIADTAEQTGMTPEQVVKAPGQYALPVDRATIDGMENVNEACLLVFGLGYRPYEEFIEYFYAADTYSAWHENSLQYCFTIGGHRFFRVVGA